MSGGRYEKTFKLAGLERNGFSSSGDPRYAVTPLRQLSINGPAPMFPDAALPKPVKRLVREAAKAIGCPPDAIGLAALVNLGAAIGNSRVIQPKRGWTEGASIYGAAIAESGEKKTAAIAAATDVTQKLENRLNRQYEQKLEQYAAEQREYEARRKDAAKEGRAAPAPPPKPTAERVAVNDTTIEALIPILKENPRGVLQERDELVGWVKAMDQYKAGGRGADRQFWLSAWSNRPVSVDRKGQDAPISVLRPFVGVVGSIQPDVLPELAQAREDGMLERFLLAFPETVNSLWTEDEISDVARVDYTDLCERLRNLSMDTDELGDPVEIPVSFSEGAKEIYINAYNEHRIEMGSPTFPPHLRSPWAKLEGYFLRLILIMAACRFVEEEEPERIEETDILRAVLLIDYFKAQARRVFGALRGLDARLPLLEDVAAFVQERGGLWTGTPTELHEQLDSSFKPERPDELSKFIQEGWEEQLGLLCEAHTDRYKNEKGEWKSRRELTLYLTQWRNGVTA
jgi:hypothetical protein